jgi:hypothetical protein
MYSYKLFLSHLPKSTFFDVFPNPNENSQVYVEDAPSKAADLLLFPEVRGFFSKSAERDSALPGLVEIVRLQTEQCSKHVLVDH